MNKIKVVIDTNVFIKSWFNDRYFYCNAIIDLLNNGKIQLVFSQDTIGELFYITKNFVSYAFEDKDSQLEYMRNLSCIFLGSISINTVKTECIELFDRSDEMFLKTAIESKADYIISDDYKSGIHKVKLEGTPILDSQKFILMYEKLGAN